MCHQWKPEAAFAFRSIATGKRQDHCRACHAAYRRQHYLDHRAEYIAREVARIKAYREGNRVLIREYLREHRCIDCGEADIVLLEFDHRDRASKSAYVTLLATHKPWKRVLVEIAKCDVRCVVCHRRRTARQMNWRSPSELLQPPIPAPPAPASLVPLRMCTGCGVMRRETEYSVKNKTTGRRSRRCLACIAAASRDHYRLNRESYLARARSRTRWLNPKRAYRLAYLATHPCVDCGETDPLLLEFDHRDTKTKVNDVSLLIWDRKWDDVSVEIAKCDVRCVRCHRRRTARDFGWSRLGEVGMIYVHAGVM